MSGVKVDAWGDDGKGPMQVVSGPVGRERVHFETPAASRLEREMRVFLDWFNTDDNTDPFLLIPVTRGPLSCIRLYRRSA